MKNDQERSTGSNLSQEEYDPCRKMLKVTKNIRKDRAKKSYYKNLIHLTKQEKMQRLKQKNRQSAQRSRQNKKKYIMELQQEVNYLRNQVQYLQSQLFKYRNNTIFEEKDNSVYQFNNDLQEPIYLADSEGRGLFASALLIIFCVIFILSFSKSTDAQQMYQIQLYNNSFPKIQMLTNYCLINS